MRFGITQMFTIKLSSLNSKRLFVHQALALKQIMALWTQHLDANSSCPIFDHSKEVTFINSRFCPFSHRICLILEAKKIP